MNYSTTIGGDRIDYWISEDNLNSSVAGRMTILVPLAGGGLLMKRKRVFSPWFRAGLVGIVIPPFTFGVVLAKDGADAIVAMGGSAWLHLCLFVVGVVLVLSHPRPRTCITVTRKKEGIVIWDGSEMPGSFDAFAAHVAAEIDRLRDHGGPGSVPGSIRRDA